MLITVNNVAISASGPPGRPASVWQPASPARPGSHLSQSDSEVNNLDQSDHLAEAARVNLPIFFFSPKYCCYLTPRYDLIKIFVRISNSVKRFGH